MPSVLPTTKKIRVARLCIEFNFKLFIEIIHSTHIYYLLFPHSSLNTLNVSYHEIILHVLKMNRLSFQS